MGVANVADRHLREAVPAVEWAERLGELLPRDCLLVALTITGDQEREIVLTGHGPRGEHLLAELAGAAGQ